MSVYILYFAALSCDKSEYFLARLPDLFQPSFWQQKKVICRPMWDMLQPSLWRFSKTSGRFAAIFLATNMGKFFCPMWEDFAALSGNKSRFISCDSGHRIGSFKARQPDILLPSLLRQQQLFFGEQHSSLQLKPLYSSNSNQVIPQRCQSINLKCRDSASAVCRNKPTFILAIGFDLCHYGSRLPF